MSLLSEALDKVFDPGKGDRQRANDLYQSSLNNTAAIDAWKKGLLQDRLDLSNQFLFGGNIQNPALAGEDGVNSSPGVNVQGALPQAQDWESRFFQFLETSPDTTYNRQRGQLESGMRDAQKALTSNLNKRGIVGSVLGASKFGDLGMNRARGLAELEGQRMDRKGERISQGTQFAQALLDRALNMGNQASGMAGNFTTNVPNMQNNYANNLMNQANAAGPGIGNELLAEASRNWLDNVFTKTTQAPPPPQSQPGGVGQQALKMYFSTMGVG